MDANAGIVPAPVIASPRDGWIVSRVTDYAVDMLSSNHRQYAGTLGISRHPSQWSRTEYFVTTSRPDSLRGHDNASFYWQDGRLVHIPRRFRNGKVRPLAAASPARHPKDIAAAEQLIRAMGWEA